MAASEAAAGKQVSPALAAIPHAEAAYAATAAFDGEVFPAFANFASLRPPLQRSFGVISVKISNPTQETLRRRVTVQVPGWSDPEIQIADVAAAEAKTLLFAPAFLPRFYQNREIAAATALVYIADAQGRTLWSLTVPLRLRSADDLDWGNNFEHADYIASWVTPHAPEVEAVLSAAKEFMPGRRLPGYETWKSTSLQERSTRIQAKSIYRALRKKGVSYVKSSLTFGGHGETSERVRMPAESLRDASANCIDGAVLYAALFENLGLEPVIVLVPGHALVAVRLAQSDSKYLYLETALTGRASFESAAQDADDRLAAVPPGEVLRISISKAREKGIFPFPSTPAIANQSETKDARVSQPDPARAAPLAQVESR